MGVAPPMTGKTVLITGGIGRAAAIGLASMGARVGLALRAETSAVSDMAKSPLRRIRRKTIALWNARMVISGPFVLVSRRR